MYDRIHHHDDPLFECSRCLREIHEYTELAHHRVNGQDVCGKCVHTCGGGCGLWLNDDDFPEKVIEVRFRELTSDGKLTDAHCPICAANSVICDFLDDRWFDFEEAQWAGEWGKDAIAQLLAKAFPLPLASAA
jgi:hypothetical protein